MDVPFKGQSETLNYFVGCGLLSEVVQKNCLPMSFINHCHLLFIKYFLHRKCRLARFSRVKANSHFTNMLKQVLTKCNLTIVGEPV